MTNRTTYWNTFLLPLYSNLVNNWKRDFYIKEKDFPYHELPPTYSIQYENIELFGYFQSPKYFEYYYPDICKLIQLENQKQLVSSKYNYDNNNEYDYKNTISMHFRIGDYSTLSHVYPILSLDYYKEALKFMLTYIHKLNHQENNELKVLYFCEEKDKSQVNLIIHNLKNEFINIEFECIDFELYDWEQMLLMSCCKYNIIANSTFSWWGAYFNNDKDKIVCYPSKWFVEGNPNNTQDLFPSDWHMVL
jgi:hypothetical protein